MIIIIKLHNDLLITIKNYEEQLEFAEDTKKSLEKLLNVRKPNDMKAQQYSDMSKGCRDDTTTDRTYARLIYTNARIDTYTSILEGLQAQVDKVQADMGKLEGLQSNVYRLHVIEGMTLQEVADELDKSLLYVQKVNSKMGQMLKNDK